MSTEQAQIALDQAPLLPPERGMIGSAETVAKALQDTAADTRANELFLLTITDRLETRIRSYGLIESALAELNAAPAEQRG